MDKRSWWVAARYAALLMVVVAWSGAAAPPCKPFVVGKLSCQLGNNMFQVAAASALAWDHGAEPLFPDLLLPEHNSKFSAMFHRCNARQPPRPIACRWQLPTGHNFCYMPIPFTADMKISGTFQSEKYFVHHRQKILELFAPRRRVYDYITQKYGHILSHPLTVAVQIRWFGVAGDAPWWPYLAQYGPEYFAAAMALFPKDALFVVSSNDAAFARSCIPADAANVVFLEGEPPHIDMYIMSLCQHAIISNSTFGWWAAWLNRNPAKRVVAPIHWIDPAWHWQTPVVDVYPDSWQRLDAPWYKHQSPAND